MQQQYSLAHFDRARQELALAQGVDEVKEIRDRAEALRVYAKQAGESLEMQNLCAEIKLRAERRAGELLREQERNRGTQGQLVGRDSSGGSIVRPPEKAALKLSDLGINKSQSSRWQKIAKVPERAFEGYIEERKTGHEELTTAGLIRISEARERQERRDERIERMVADSIESIDRCFPVIYADPPWQYEHSRTQSRDIENQYPTMSLDDICELNIHDISTANAILFLWSTSPKLSEAMEVVDAWGFGYRTCIVWVKDRIGMGYYARQRHELLLIATRGEMPTPEPATRPDSVIESPREEHSKKPDIVYELIEQMYPELPKVELFARQKREGWNVWGNEST